MAWIAQQLLTAIAEASPNDCITEERMAELTQLEPLQVDRACYSLRKHGLIEKVGKGCHQLTDAGREAHAAGGAITSGPKGKHGSVRRKTEKRTLRDLAWNAMRIRRKFTLPDLISLVAQGGEKDIESNLGKYVKALCLAGILLELPRRESGTAMTSNGYKRYWLTDEKDTGPLAPIWRASYKQVYDPNTEVIHELA